jgi:hypothetical protein
VSRLPELAAKIDAFFERVTARHGPDMQCHTGCSDCCHVRLTVTGVEAAAIRAVVAGWPDAGRARLRAVIAEAPADRCAALDASGRCAIYAARPVVCRSHGVPIRIRERSLPVVQACHRNFAARGPAGVDADCVLDQTTLSALTLAVDREAGGDGARHDLASLLGDVAGA